MRQSIGTDVSVPDGSRLVFYVIRDGRIDVIGRRDGGTQQLWGASDFAFLKPLHVESKAKVALDEPLLQMDETDEIELSWIETYLTHAPFLDGPDGRSPEPHEHPWSRIYSEGVLGERLRRTIVEQWNRMSSASATSEADNGG